MAAVSERVNSATSYVITCDYERGQVRMPTNRGVQFINEIADVAGSEEGQPIFNRYDIRAVRRQLSLLPAHSLVYSAQFVLRVSWAIETGIQTSFNAPFV